MFYSAVVSCRFPYSLTCMYFMTTVHIKHLLEHFTSLCSPNFLAERSRRKAVLGVVHPPVVACCNRTACFGTIIALVFMPVARSIPTSQSRGGCVSVCVASAQHCGTFTAISAVNCCVQRSACSDGAGVNPGWPTYFCSASMF